MRGGPGRAARPSDRAGRRRDAAPPSASGPALGRPAGGSRRCGDPPRRRGRRRLAGRQRRRRAPAGRRRPGRAPHPGRPPVQPPPKEEAGAAAVTADGPDLLQATTIGVIVTNARVDKVGCLRPGAVRPRRAGPGPRPGAHRRRRRRPGRGRDRGRWRRRWKWCAPWRPGWSNRRSSTPCPQFSDRCPNPFPDAPPPFNWAQFASLKPPAPSLRAQFASAPAPRAGASRRGEHASLAPSATGAFSGQLQRPGRGRRAGVKMHHSPHQPQEHLFFRSGKRRQVCAGFYA